MKRPRYPSDDNRIKRPHIKVHLSWKHHPRYAAAWADPLIRGIVVGIWDFAAAAHASKTGDRLTLSTAAIMALTGCKGASGSVQRLRRVCASMAWDLSESPAGWVIHIRNFARKQGFAPQLRNGDSATPHPPTPTPIPNSSSSPTPTIPEISFQEREVAPPAPARARSRSRRKPEVEAPQDLSLEEKAELSAWIDQEIRKGVLPASFGDKAVKRRMVGACLDHFRGNGELKADWRATVRNWIRREAHPGPKANGRARELPQMPPEGRGGELLPLGDAQAILKLVTR